MSSKERTNCVGFFLITWAYPWNFLCNSTAKLTIAFFQDVSSTFQSGLQEWNILMVSHLSINQVEFSLIFLR